MCKGKVDNWKNREKGMICETCWVYAPKKDKPHGRCRANPPTMKGYPVVYPDDWCGAHKLK